MWHFLDAKHLSPTVKMPPVIFMSPHIQMLGIRELKLLHKGFGF